MFSFRRVVPLSFDTGPSINPHGVDHLDLVLAVGYVSKLLRNGKVIGHLGKHFQELLFEVQKITESEATAA